MSPIIHLFDTEENYKRQIVCGLRMGKGLAVWPTLTQPKQHTSAHTIKQTNMDARMHMAHAFTNATLISPNHTQSWANQCTPFHTPTLHAKHSPNHPSTHIQPTHWHSNHPFNKRKSAQTDHAN